MSVTVDGEEVLIVSAPSMVLVAGRYRESVAENSESITDAKGNKFTVSVGSSSVGVDWELTVVTDDQSLEGRIAVEYQANDY